MITNDDPTVTNTTMQPSNVTIPTNNNNNETKTNTLEEEDKASRQHRKDEAKKRKRQRIEEAGGVRPRTNPQPPNQKSKRKRNRKPNPSSNNTHDEPSSSSSHHRWGRVMEETPCPNQPRHSTLSIAVPGSVVSNAQTQELRTRLVGQIARAAAVYHVDEVVVFDDRLADEIKVRPSSYGSDRRNRYGAGGARRDRGTAEDGGGGKGDKGGGNGNDDGNATTTPSPKASTDPHAFMARILQYCECPQYLRRHFFPVHPDLQFAGLLPPIDAPHHVRLLDRAEFREGVVLEKKRKDDGDDGTAVSLVNCGVRGRDLEIDRTLPPGIRCTVQIHRKAYSTPGKRMQGTVVSPNTPRQQNGTYWGYTTRIAPSLSAIFDQSPYPGGYDFKIGTSERGDVTVDDPNFWKRFPGPVLDGVVVERDQQQHDTGDDDEEDNRSNNNDNNNNNNNNNNNHKKSGWSFRHAIVVFGGVAGIEECVDADETMTLSGSDSRSLFDLWVNTCPYQGSRTIRTEEAIWISLARLRPHLFPVSNGSGGGNSSETTTRSKTTVAAEQVVFSDSAPSEESSDEEGK